MINGTMTSERDGNARVWTLSVLVAPRPGELISWDEPALGSHPARDDVRGWIVDEESTRPGTVIVQVAGESTRWVKVNVIPHTGQYDREAEGARLTEANEARIAADPFSTVPVLDGCTCPPVEDGSARSWHFKTCPWAMSAPAAEADPEAPTPGSDTVLARDVKRGWHMAGVGTIETVTRGAHDLVTFNGPEGTRAFARYTLVEVTRPAPVMWAAEWPYPEFTAAEFAAHYLLAAEVIAARGYNAEEMRGYDGTPGVSICTALKIAARERAQAADPEGLEGDPAQTREARWEITAANVTEELETRLSAVIYTLGLLHARTGISDFSDQLAAWELGHYTTGPNPTRSDALGLLATAAGIFAHISDTQAPVTAPAVPGQ
jgi:hypothetical protein